MQMIFSFKDNGETSFSFDLKKGEEVRITTDAIVLTDKDDHSFVIQSKNLESIKIVRYKKCKGRKVNEIKESE